MRHSGCGPTPSSPTDLQGPLCHETAGMSACVSLAVSGLYPATRKASVSLHMSFGHRDPLVDYLGLHA